ncbi:SDR family oxidoreductase [Barrientosiimonas endolithica]|uniref:Short chain dehydrogenase n=1 Tax=Barrientosiimonas endolithica TaxID=1535208 RepID=A0ABN6YPS2_9MICO|nr:SDR family oxidoreductase [Barrientosiimonas endolithica]BDZ59429.1 short chain dehydrogenase [Barrientosiimonas endolithica]
MSIFDLEGKTALVTGAASGIGQACAVELARMGAGVALVDRSTDGLASVAAAVRTAGARSLPLTADVTVPGEIDEAVERVVRDWGRLDIAVNSAGIAHAAPAADLADEDWARVFDVNATGLFRSCRAEGRVMLEAGEGAIVNISSMSGVIANRGLEQVHYNASKAAVTHLTKSLAVEWAGRGVRVNAVSPGYTATPMNTRAEVADQVREFEDQTPMGRMAEPREIAGPVVFLASPAASFCTGVDLLVDGGFCCW